MFSSNGAFKTTGLLHAKIHPIVMLFILIVHILCMFICGVPPDDDNTLSWDGPTCSTTPGRHEQMLPQHCLNSEWSAAAIELADGSESTDLLGS